MKKEMLSKIAIIAACIMLAVFTSCKKDEEEPSGSGSGTGGGTGGGTGSGTTTLAVTTSQVADITQTTATCGGNVTDDGGYAVTSRGVCWSTSQNPTVADSYTTDGSGTGSFSSSITNLTEGTTYYVRAYAINEHDVKYGDEESFTTETGGSGGGTVTVNGVTFKMIAVDGGTFYMGAQSSDPSGQNYDSEADDNESPVHQVTLSSFCIGETEVTQELWTAVMGSNPSYSSGSNLPVETVSWNDVQEFIVMLNQMTGKSFRLPTEAEWEFAARGGKKSGGYKYSGSNTINNVAWYGNHNGGGTATSATTYAVGTKAPNELGIYDMSGNVFEWCQDWYGEYNNGSQTNPTGLSTGSNRVGRGGGWVDDAKYCRVQLRGGSNPGSRYIDCGFRLASR